MATLGNKNGGYRIFRNDVELTVDDGFCVPSLTAGGFTRGTTTCPCVNAPANQNGCAVKRKVASNNIEFNDWVLSLECDPCLHANFWCSDEADEWRIIFPDEDNCEYTFTAFAQLGDAEIDGDSDECITCDLTLTPDGELYIVDGDVIAGPPPP